MEGWWMVPLNYLFGSVPFGVLIGWFMRGVDIRQYGSGNIGATNVARVAGPLAAVSSGVADALKGLGGVYLANQAVSSSFLWFIAIFAIIAGHNWSVFLRFKGGKGVATTFGIVFALSWQVGILCFLSWFGMVAFFRYSSLGSLTAAAALPVFLFLLGHPPHYIWWGILAAALVFWRHKENIYRLYTGKERKIGGFKKRSERT